MEKPENIEYAPDSRRGDLTLSKLFALLLALALALGGQTRVNLQNQTKAGSGTAIPSTCTPGQTFYQTNTLLLYTCTSPNTYTLGLGGGNYNTLVNVPTAFTPLSHANSHRHGGADEISSPTPGPNIIPQAGSGGTLAIGFLASGTPTGGKFVRDDGTLAVPGTGSIVLTSGAGTPGAPDNIQTGCAAPTSNNLAIYTDTTHHDQWWCSATDTWLKLLSVTNVGPYEVIGGTGTVPSTPAAGSVACYFDSTSNTQVCIDSGGNASSMVKGLALTVVGKGTGGGSWTTIVNSGGTATVTVSGALTTDTVVCTETTAIQHGAAPHYLDYLSCQITASNTLKAYMEMHEIDDNLWFPPTTQTFNYIVYR